MNLKSLGIAKLVMVMAIIISVILLFLGIGVLVLIHICIVGGAFRRGLQNNNNNNNTNERGSLASTSMSRDDIEKLPSFDFRERVKGSSPVDCSVCLENFKAGDKCRLLPICKHSFHANCVDLWLLKTPICPICRTNNGAWRVGSEVSSLFSESGYFNEVSLGQSGHFGEAVLGLGDSQRGISGNLSEIVVENGDFSGNLNEDLVENGNFGKVNVELSDIRMGISGNLSEIIVKNGDFSGNSNEVSVENGHFDEVNVELRNIEGGKNQTNENTSYEISMGQSGNFGEAVSGLGDCRTGESGNLSEIVVENGEFSEILNAFSVENDHFGEVNIELSDIRTKDNSHLGDPEPGENQINENSNIEISSRQCAHFGDDVLELGDGYLSKIVVEKGDSSENSEEVSVTNDHFGEVITELSDIQTGNNSHLGDPKLFENRINENSKNKVIPE